MGTAWSRCPTARATTRRGGERGGALAEALDAHLDEEERDLVAALAAGGPRRDAARREVARMARHHREVRPLLARVRSLADGYVAPEWGGASYRALMEELEALEEDVV